MHPTELKAYKFKIENTDGSILNDILKQIITLGEFPPELLSAIINALNTGKNISSKTLCDILISTQSKEIYQLAQSKNLLFNWELVRLLKSGFPAPKIEEHLCKELYKYFSDDAQPLNRN